MRRVPVNGDAAGSQQIRLCKAAAEHSDRAHASLASCFGIIGRIADDNGFVCGHARQLSQRRLEEVGERLRAFSVASGGLRVQLIVFDADDAFEGGERPALGRGGKRIPETGLLNVLHQLSRLRKSADLG
jgi:hypothetical protein